MEKPNPLSRLIEYAMLGVMEDFKSLYIGKIKKIKPPTATVQPLTILAGSKQNEVSEVHFIVIPFANNLYVDDVKRDNKIVKTKLAYKEGDKVVVAVFDHDNQKFDPDNAVPFTPVSKQPHSIDYSIVLGRYAVKDDFNKPQGKNLDDVKY